MPASTKTRPIAKFATAVGQCSAQAAVYGKCIVADYNDIHKNKCGEEFAKFQECVKVALKK
ncbi:hypothetical protein BJ508DRAFT_235606 [Ascobolus immersus RN42]|uniref:IMS import disulfide relay-system CHCH-CHCH-like Cx9C domain-containing protein n=1 Tax=Ascobolus immersus RN42 TaxID=1160509 RepID=A0A3N4ILI5_ASCIM|nr:hypothetical protein BJ508DRAFT_235606 [Ascobolus immersus RN42]